MRPQCGHDPKLVNGGRAFYLPDVLGLLVDGRGERLTDLETREATPTLAVQPQATRARKVHRRVSLAVRALHRGISAEGRLAILRLRSREVTRFHRGLRANKNEPAA
jgi:hypothetical protein